MILSRFRGEYGKVSATLWMWSATADTEGFAGRTKILIRGQSVVGNTSRLLARCRGTEALRSTIGSQHILWWQPYTLPDVCPRQMKHRFETWMYDYSPPLPAGQSAGARSERRVLVSRFRPGAPRIIAAIANGRPLAATCFPWSRMRDS